MASSPHPGHAGRGIAIRRQRCGQGRESLAYGFLEAMLTRLSLSVLPSKKLSGLLTRSAATARLQLNVIASSELVSSQRMRIVQPHVIGERSSVG